EIHEWDCRLNEICLDVSCCGFMGKSFASHRSGYEFEEQRKERPADMVRIACSFHSNRSCFSAKTTEAECTCTPRIRTARIRSEQAGSERAASRPSAASGRQPQCPAARGSGREQSWRWSKLAQSWAWWSELAQPRTRRSECE